MSCETNKKDSYLDQLLFALSLYYWSLKLSWGIIFKWKYQKKVLKWLENIIQSTCYHYQWITQSQISTMHFYKKNNQYFQ